MSQTGKEITSTALLRLIDYLDAFVDHGPSFQSFLEAQEVGEICRGLGLRQRNRNRHHPSVGTYMYFGER